MHGLNTWQQTYVRICMGDGESVSNGRFKYCQSLRLWVICCVEDFCSSLWLLVLADTSDHHVAL